MRSASPHPRAACVAVARRGWLVLALALAGAVTACGTRDAPPIGVVVVLVDALRADHLGCYGYARPTSPRLDAMAAESVRFAHAYTVAPWTLPAMSSMWTSLYPSVHGATKAPPMPGGATGPQRLPPSSILDASRTTLAEILRARGFATAAFLDGVYATSLFNVTQGFDVVVDKESRGVRPNIEALLAWLDRARPARFFGYVHVLSVHSPYVAPELRLEPARAAQQYPTQMEELARYRAHAFDPGYHGGFDGSQAALGALVRPGTQPPPRDVEHLAALYDQGVAYTDEWIGRLLDGLQARRLLDRVVVVVTADHGEELLDHGGVMHGATLYEEILHVPLLVRIPHAGGRVVDDTVASIDLAPTLLALLGLEPVAAIQGRSLLPLLDGGTLPPRALLAEATSVGDGRALRSDGWKLIATGTERRLFDLRADPGETVDRCGDEPARCGALAQELAAQEAENRRVAVSLGYQAAPPAQVDDATRERLRALGYANP